MLAALSLSDKQYQAQPLKRIYIPKPGKDTKRPLSIPTMYDRAMQALYALALQPVAETLADSRSFGFRLFRSAQDASQYLFVCLRHKTGAEWILEGDIKGCFDNISHQWLKENVLIDSSILNQFLKSGYLYELTLFPTDQGTPQGGIISPILANLALDGMEKVIMQRYPKMKVHFVRYADDFVVTAPTMEIAEELKVLISSFLSERGLVLSESKTKITHINDGFDFLGYNIRKYKGVLLMKPSKESVKKITRKIALVLFKAAAWNQEQVIQILNPIIKGWTNYHRHIASKETFNRMDYVG
jgi:RNA-directed DNA polymerase